MKEGSTRAEVEACLDAHGFTHYYRNHRAPFGEEAIDSWELRPLPGPGMERPLRPFQCGGVIESWFPANVDWFWGGRIRLTIVFDRDGKAVGYVVMPVVDA